MGVPTTWLRTTGVEECDVLKMYKRGLRQVCLLWSFEKVQTLNRSHFKGIFHQGYILHKK